MIDDEMKGFMALVIDKLNRIEATAAYKAAITPSVVPAADALKKAVDDTMAMFERVAEAAAAQNRYLGQLAAEIARGK